MKGRPKLPLTLSRKDRVALSELAGRHADSPSLALRAQIVLACAEGLDNVEVAARARSTAHTVSKWRRRFIVHGVEGLTDLPRSGAPRTIDDATAAVIASRKRDRATGATSIRRVAREANVSAASVGRIWKNMDRSAKRLDVRASSGASQTSRQGAAVANSGATTPGVNVNSRGADARNRGVSADGGFRESGHPLDDFAQAFHMAPIGLLVSRQRVIVTCNQAFSEIFGCAREELAGRSLECLYPSYDEFQHVGERAWPVMKETGFYSDERIMRKLDGSPFWCHVSGRSMNREDPFAAAIWAFEDISSVRRVTRDLTQREREVAQLLVTGKSSKQIARDLQISHRTVEAHRGRLMRKYGAMTTAELIGKLVGRDR